MRRESEPHMDRRRFLTALAPLALVGSPLLLLSGCSSGKQQPRAAAPKSRPAPETGPRPPAPPVAAPLLLGIDVLEQRGFDVLRGKRSGLLTHTAAVNRLGTPTWRVLQRNPSVKLRALYAPEHGLEGQLQANEKFGTSTHKPTGLPVYPAYGKTRKPTPEMLKDIEVLVIDLQDIGSRSYTFISAMRLAVEACFEQGKEVVILDRPNPLGGLKVDGPPMDARWMSYVGAFQIPYVHGLTIGELARMSQATPGMLQVPQAVRQRGKLTVVPMQGWRRTMRWPDTGLVFQATSPFVQDFAATVGYAMVGLGCELSGFSHGVGRQHAFRTLQYKGLQPEQLKAELDALRLPGVGFRILSYNAPGSTLPARTVYVDVVDWTAWRPTELSLHLHRLGAKFAGRNVYQRASANQVELFNKHVGSQAYWDALVRDGARLQVAPFVTEWSSKAQAFQANSRVHWLYA